MAPPRASVGGGTSRARLEARAEDVTRPGNWPAGARDGRSGGKDAAGVYVNIVRRVARGRSRVEQGKRGRTAVGERTGTGQAASPRGAGGGHWLACGEAEEAARAGGGGRPVSAGGLFATKPEREARDGPIGVAGGWGAHDAEGRAVPKTHESRGSAGAFLCEVCAMRIGEVASRVDRPESRVNDSVSPLGLFQPPPASMHAS